MKSNRNLIKVVMDGITDSSMLYDYAEIAKDDGNETLRQWFKSKADDRTARTEAEWNDVKSVLKLNETRDEMASCLKDHIDDEMAKLKARMHK